MNRLKVLLPFFRSFSGLLPPSSARYDGAAARSPEVAMTKTRKLVVLGVAAVGLVAGPLLYLQSLPKMPFWAKYAMVRQGMTVEEVHATLGKPNWASNTPPYRHDSIMVEVRLAGDSPEIASWVLWKEEYSDAGSAGVGPSFFNPPESGETAYVFFANGRVTRKEYVQGDRRWPKVLQSFFDLFGP
jgi:hypothetical protein